MDRRTLHRHARLTSGLILFIYVATHLANHALGSISMATAERGLRIAVLVWQSVPGTLLLYGAAATHVALAFAAVYERRTLRMPPLELLRMVLGFGMPTLLIGHAVATRGAAAIYGHPPDYAHVVWMLEHSGRQGLQIALLVPGWLHGCLGLRFAFGRRAWFARSRSILFGAALLLPVLAVMGFLAMTKEVSALAADPAWAPRVAAAATPGEHASLDLLRSRLLLAYGTAIGAILLARHVRAFVAERRGTLVSIAYPGRVVRVPAGWSVLEASRAHAIDHRSSCGGQGRCSTCRVRVTAGADGCPPPSGIERDTLARVAASSDVRLACQLRPCADISVVPLLRDGAVLRAGHHEAIERDLVACRVAVRWGQSFERLLPHDRLYAIRRFHETVESAVARTDLGICERSHDHMTSWVAIGQVDDARRALRAAAMLAGAVDPLARELARTIGCRAGFVVALHRDVGVVDEPGVESTVQAVAVGDAFEAVRRVTQDAATAPPALLVSTSLLAVAAPSLARGAALHVALADGRRVGFAQVTTDVTQPVVDASRRTATAALDRVYG